MKKRIVTALLLVSLPVASFALDYQHGDDDYSDVGSFSVAEQAAISVLTDVGAVAGNPDGSFAPDRTLNRAEFTKIAVASAPDGRILEADYAKDPMPADSDPWCFPDARIGDWFSPYICAAKDAGIVQGNPDGLFHPERSVNYVEALKILVEIADYTLPEPPENERWMWYRPYVLAAEEHGVALPGSVEPDHLLTRGQMARLAAAFVAEAEGELDEYRRAERGQFGDVSSSSSSPASSESSESSSSSSSISSSSASSSISSSSPLFPAQNSFLLTGRRTPAILGGTMVSDTEASILKVTHLTLRREILSINKVFLVDSNGQNITELTLATSNNTDYRKWESVTPTSTFTFPANTPVLIGIVFELDPKDGGGSSSELVEIETFSLQTEGTTTGQSKFLLPQNQVYPIHQTSFGRLTLVQGALPDTGTITAGQQKLLSTVQFRSETATGGSVSLESLEFLFETTNVNGSNFKIGNMATGQLVDCGVEKLGTTHIVCGSVPDALEGISSEGTVLSLYGDLSLPGPGTATARIVLENRGRIGQNGSVKWTDSSGRFNWVEERAVFDSDVTWTVTP